MKAKLKVLTGGSAGKELKLKEGQFLIGRSDSCHLRPRSDAISRKHCVFFIDPAGIRIRDLKSRNGTAVNGEKIAGDCQLKSGDKIAVGPLEFELLMSAPQESPKKPAPKQQPKAPAPSPKKQPAASGAPADGGSVEDDDIFGWLEEADEVDREERLTDPSTRHFKVDQTDPSTETVDMANADGSDTSVGKGKKGKGKPEPGKLPTAAEKTTENSQQAAADALKQFFKRA